MHCQQKRNCPWAKMMMNTKQRMLDEERLQDFVGDFNKHFEDLAKRYKNDAQRIKNIRESFWERYPEIFNDSSENEVEMETTMETESRPIIDREEKLLRVKEKLLSNKTNERLTNYDGVMSDDSLSLSQKIIHLQEDWWCNKKKNPLRFITRRIIWKMLSSIQESL